MSALGWGLGLQNAQQALAQMLALRESNRNRADERERFTGNQALAREQMAQQATLSREQLAQAASQFDANKAFQQERAGKEDERFGLENSRANNLFGLQQMQADFGMRNAVSPGQQHQWEVELAKMREQGDSARAALARQTQLETTRMNVQGREKDPMEQFRAGLTGVYGRGVSDGQDPAEIRSQLQTYIQALGPVFGFKFDQDATHNFLTPGVDPWIKANFGGDYDAAQKGVESDPDTYFKLVSQGVDPSAVSSAIKKSVSDLAATRAARGGSAAPPAPPTPAGPGLMDRLSGMFSSPAQASTPQPSARPAPGQPGPVATSPRPVATPPAPPVATPAPRVAPSAGTPMASPAAPKPTGSPAAGVGPYEMRLPPETGKSKTDYLFDDFAALQDLMGSVKGKVAPAMDAMSDLRSSPDMTRQAIAGIDQDLASKGGPQGLIQFVKQNEDALRQRGVNIDAYMNAIMARAQQ